MGLLGSECSQTHCFFSGPVDFYSSWCKWADKGTVGTGLWPSCLLSHCGQVVLSFRHNESGVFSAAHMTGPVWSRLLAAGDTVVVRGGLLQALNCVAPKTLVGHRKHHTLLNNVITENSWKTGVGMTLISRVIFGFVICYRALLSSSCLLLKGTFFVVVQLSLRSIFTISDSPLRPL